MLTKQVWKSNLPIVYKLEETPDGTQLNVLRALKNHGVTVRVGFLVHVTHHSVQWLLISTPYHDFQHLKDRLFFLASYTIHSLFPSHSGTHTTLSHLHLTFSLNIILLSVNPVFYPFSFILGQPRVPRGLSHISHLGGVGVFWAYQLAFCSLITMQRRKWWYELEYHYSRVRTHYSCLFFIVYLHSTFTCTNSLNLLHNKYVDLALLSLYHRNFGVEYLTDLSKVT